jgi:hypothetical protein
MGKERSSGKKMSRTTGKGVPIRGEETALHAQTGEPVRADEDGSRADLLTALGWVICLCCGKIMGHGGPDCTCCAARASMPGVIYPTQPDVLEERPGPRARKRIREAAAERDGWLCGFCRRPIDPNEAWPHPLALVGDHWPIPRHCGGPYSLPNIRAAHSYCNGSTAGMRPHKLPFTITEAQAELLAVIVPLIDSQRAERTAASNARMWARASPEQRVLMTRMGWQPDDEEA